MDLELGAIGLVGGRGIGVAESCKNDISGAIITDLDRQTNYLACRKQAMLEHLVDGTQRLEDWKRGLHQYSPLLPGPAWPAPAASERARCMRGTHACIEDDLEGLGRCSKCDLRVVLSVEVVYTHSFLHRQLCFSSCHYERGVEEGNDVLERGTP